MANHMVARESTARVTRFLPRISRSTSAARNGINAIATRAWGLIASARWGVGMHKCSAAMV